MVERFNRRFGEHLARMPHTRGATTAAFSATPKCEAYLQTFVADYNRTCLRCLDYHAPDEFLAKLAGHNTFAGVGCERCRQLLLVDPPHGWR
jgi:hypothetical protein